MAATELTPYRVEVEDALAVWDRTCGPTSGRFDLMPVQAVERYNAANEHPLRRLALPDWTAFEYGHIEWNHNDFVRLLGLDDIPAGVRLFLVTDEGLRDGSAFHFVRSAFILFVDWYEDVYRMDFFQSADYLLFDETLAYVRILHHEGALFRD